MDGYTRGGVKVLLCAVVNDARGKVFFFLISIEINNNTSLTLGCGVFFLVLVNGLFSP